MLEPDKFEPKTPGDLISELLPSHGHVRNFLERIALAPIDEKSQETAGDAAVLNALGNLYDIDGAHMATGFQSVRGAESAAGGAKHLSEPEPGIPQDPGTAAFFDVDNTLVQGASIFLFGLGLFTRGYIKRGDLAGMIWKQVKFRVSGAENADDVHSTREQVLEFFKGHSVAETVAMGEEIFDEKIAGRIYDGTKELARLHLEAGQEVWLVTAAPVQLAQVIAQRMGLTGALGTVAEVEDGKFTGRLVGDILHGPGKKHAVAALAASSGMDLARCTAYSDSSNDIPMLSMVGTAVAINPDRALRAWAKKQGWAIHDYRKVRTASMYAARWSAGIAGGIATAAAMVGIAAVVKRFFASRR